MPPPTTWDDWIRWSLCEIYKKLGGDCADLGFEPNQRVKEVADEYAIAGPPTFQNPQERSDFLQLLDDIETHLKKPENSLDAAHNAQLYGLIADLRSKV